MCVLERVVVFVVFWSGAPVGPLPAWCLSRVCVVACVWLLLPPRFTVSSSGVSIPGCFVRCVGLCVGVAVSARAVRLALEARGPCAVLLFVRG